MDTTHTASRRAEARSVTEQAAEWLMILESEGDRANPAFAGWLRESPTHVQAYLRAATLDTMLRHMDPERSIEIVKPDPATLIPDIGPGPRDDLFGEHGSDRPRWRGAWRLAAAVAVLGLALGWGVVQQATQEGATYRTDVGEQRTVALQDGSTLTLNTDSRASVHFTATERQVRLLSGEALFRVQRDPSRPFRVQSGTSIVQAIGTEFDVYRKSDQTLVSVLEGRVAVNQAGGRVFLDTGEQLRVRDGSKAQPKRKTNVAEVTAWRERRLVFIEEPLSVIGDELNRYNRTPKIRVEGAVAQQLEYAVMLDADDPESLIAVLARDPRVKVERSDSEIVVRAR